MSPVVTEKVVSKVIMRTKELFERLRENIGWKPMQKTNRGFKL